MNQFSDQTAITSVSNLKSTLQTVCGHVIQKNIKGKLHDLTFTVASFDTFDDALVIEQNLILLDRDIYRSSVDSAVVCVSQV